MIFRDPAPAPVDGGAFTVSINVLVVPSTAGLPATVTDSRNQLRARGGYTSTADEDAVLSDGTPAHLFGGAFAVSGHRLRNLQMLAVAGGSTIVVTGTAPAQGWDSYVGVLDDALRTLTISP